MKKNEISPDSSESEMDVDAGEEKIGSDTDSSSEVDVGGDDNEPTRRAESVPISRATDPFMDSFYGLTSSDNVERSRSAQVLIRHCLLGPDANAKDASYALKRLLNGLCSGRAASRQGMASTLSTFLKYAFRLNRMEEIRKQNESPEESELTHLAFIRKRLKSATELTGDQKSGRKKESEERDYQFGQLFGINAVIKSGVLLPVYDNHPELDDIERVSADLIRDLVVLYNAKKWMREPATHAMATILNMFFNDSTKSKSVRKIVKGIVNDVVVPVFLQVPNPKTKSTSAIFSQFSVEQLALALNIHSNIENEQGFDLPFPLNKQLLTKDTMPFITPILCETSSASLPRVHFVWDCIFSYLTKVVVNTELSIETRKVRKTFYMGTESAEEIIGGLVQHIIIDTLLKIDVDSHNNVDTKTVQDRTALALRLIRCLTGVEYLSSLAGRTKIIVESQILESVILTPSLIKKLFLDVLSSSPGGRKQSSENSLKTESLQILETIMQTTMDNSIDADTKIIDVSDQIKRRLTIATAFVRADPRFDAKTKTTYVSDVLGIGSRSVIDVHTLGLLESFTCFAINQVSMADIVDSPSAIISHEAVGYVDLLFHIAQSLMRTDGNKTIVELVGEKRSLLDKIIRFFMLAAFFDCKSVTKVDEKERKGKKKRKDSITRDPYHDEAFQLHSTRSKLSSALPYSVRIVLSARFFSLWAGYINFLSQMSVANKETAVLKLVANLADFSDQLTKFGAVKVSDVPKSSSKMEDMDDNVDDEDQPPSIIVEKLMKTANTHTSDGPGRRLSETFATLAATLSLHLLSCGQSGSV
jgi:DNA polymerase phi